MAQRVYTIYLIPQWAERGKMVLNAHSLLPAISVSSATLPWCFSSSGETHASCLTVSQLIICFVLSAQTGISGHVITDLYDSLRLKWQFTSTYISMHQIHCDAVMNYKCHHHHRQWLMLLTSAIGPYYGVIPLWATWWPLAFFSHLHLCGHLATAHQAESASSLHYLFYLSKSIRQSVMSANCEHGAKLAFMSPDAWKISIRSCWGKYLPL